MSNRMQGLIATFEGIEKTRKELEAAMSNPLMSELDKMAISERLVSLYICINPAEVIEAVTDRNFKTRKAS